MKVFELEFASLLKADLFDIQNMMVLKYCIGRHSVLNADDHLRCSSLQTV